MKRRIFSILLTLGMLLSLIPATALAVSAENFPDMPSESHWSYPALSSAVKNGLLQGSSGFLLPDKDMSRAELAIILNRVFGAQEQADISGYTDVDAAAWYAPEIAKAVRMGAFQGSGGGLMRPGDAITREEAFLVVARAFKLAEGGTNALAGFSDHAKVSTWAAPALASLVNAGYVHGSGGKLNPTARISRAEFAQVMRNLVSVYLSAPGTYTDSVDGNVVVNAPGVTLKGVTITGDLILGDGVGSGDVTLDGVKVEGRLVVRGGGENSIHIINQSDVGSVVISKTASGGIRIQAEEGCRVQVVYVDDGSDEVILEGVYNTVTVATDIPVTLNNAGVTTLSLTAETASVTLSGTSTVTTAAIAESAAGATVTVGTGSKIALVESAAPEVIIQGTGTVTQAVISGNNTAVNTKQTDITVEQGTTGVTENGTAVSPGTGGTGGGGGSTSGTATVSNEEAFLAAAKNSSVTSIVVSGKFAIHSDVSVTKPVTVSASGELGIVGMVKLYSTLTNNGTLATISVPGDGIDGWLCVRTTGFLSGDAGKLVNNGNFLNNGHLELNALTTVENSGTFQNAGTIYYVDILGLNEQDATKEALYQAPRVPNLTDDGGIVQNVAIVYSSGTLQTALAQNVSGTDTPYFSVVATPEEYDITFTAAGNLTVRPGQQLYLEEGATVIIPSGLSLVISEDGVLHLYGTLIINGTATNNGLYMRDYTGVLSGTITDQGNGKRYNGYRVANQTDWETALSDPDCYIVNLTGSITITGDTDIGFHVICEKEGALTIASGASLTMKTITDPIIGNIHMVMNGTLTNNGTLVLEPEAGILVGRDGVLINNGLIDCYGWLDANEETIGGTIHHYANLTDVARCLWNRLGGILPENVNEATDYDTYVDALLGMGDDDTQGRYAVTWLLKNGVLSTEGFEPYAYADGEKIGDLLEEFARIAGKSYTASVTGGVLTNDYTEEHGSSLDQLIDSFVTALDVDSVDVADEAALRAAQEKNYVEEIHITSNIALTNNFNVTKHVVVDAGATLTVAADKNLIVDWREWTEVQEGYDGSLVINGTLSVPAGGEVINKCRIELYGTLVNHGTFTNQKDEQEGKYGGNLLCEGGVLTNNGTFVNNDYTELFNTALENAGAFTNNEGLIITGGSITNSAPFHNAGYMKVNDRYYDNLATGSSNAVVTISMGGKLTDDSNWIDYTAAVYTADGLAAAQAAQAAKIASLGDNPAETGLEAYNRMDIMADITLTGSIDISGWGVWVETDEHWDQDTQQMVYDPYTLTIANGAALALTDGSGLHVEGNLINHGTITLGTAETYADIQVWPTGSFENHGTVTVTNGTVSRMDEYKDDGSAEFLSEGVVTGYSGAQDIAIVHDWEALQDAAGSSTYERIDIMGNDCDIVLQSNLTINANVFIEWDDGIEVPEGRTLTLAGQHWLNNSGDIWVYGTLQIGEDMEVHNDSYIQIDGTVTNNGGIFNYNNITLMSGGKLEGSGTVCNWSGSSFTNGGTVTCGNYQMAENLDELKNAMDSGIPVLVAGSVTLTEDLTLTGDVTVGLPNFRPGSLYTGNHTLTVSPDVTLAVLCGELEIGGGGRLDNQGSLTFGPDSGLRILTDGTLATTSDVYVYGWLNLHDWDNQHDYIQGNVYHYIDECGLVQHLYNFLYETDQTGVPTGVKDGVTGVADCASFDDPGELAAIGASLTGWSQLSSDSFGQYAYAALKQNHILYDTQNPYSKITYASLKALLTEFAARFGVENDPDVSDYLSGISDSNDFVCNNNFDLTADPRVQSDFNALFDGFTAVLPETLTLVAS